MGSELLHVINISFKYKNVFRDLKSIEEIRAFINEIKERYPHTKLHSIATSIDKFKVPQIEGIMKNKADLIEFLDTISEDDGMKLKERVSEKEIAEEKSEFISKFTISEKIVKKILTGNFGLKAVISDKSVKRTVYRDGTLRINYDLFKGIVDLCCDSFDAGEQVFDALLNQEKYKDEKEYANLKENSLPYELDLLAIKGRSSVLWYNEIFTKGLSNLEEKELRKIIHLKLFEADYYVPKKYKRITIENIVNLNKIYQKTNNQFRRRFLELVSEKNV
jgi:hypothetical protein